MTTLLVDAENTSIGETSDQDITVRIEKLRDFMRKEGVQAYLIPSADPHNNEYVPECWKRREFISGFTGSAGDVVITLEEGGLWTDGRYFLQAEEQLKGTGIDLYKQGADGVPLVSEWVADRLADGGVLGVDPQLLSIESAAKMEKAFSVQGGSIRYIEGNLVDEVWADRPGRGSFPIEVIPESVAGRSVQEKVKWVRKEMAQKHCEAHLICSLDSIAWLFNLRGCDIDYNRVFLAYALLTDEQLHLFMDLEQVTDEIRSHLDGLVEIHCYDEIAPFLKTVTQDGGVKRIWVDPKNTNKGLEVQIEEGAETHEERSPVIDLKAVKNEVELEGFRSCHQADGVAMVKFWKWLEHAITEEKVTELSVARKLAEFRAEQPGFIKLSFPTICGYGAHGAVIHYDADPGSDVEVKPGGILLLDSGGHYETGTTDITRTFAIGEPTAEQKDVFTRVLKGLIGLTTLRFPMGFSGKQLELPARKALWDSGRNFNHGTGHGVGHSLNVHEGPVYFSPKATETPLKPGHVLSNEPGFYKTGEFGVRLENLMIVRKEESLSTPEQEFLGFETITYCPIDLSLVDKSLLNDDEVAWLNNYHRSNYDVLSSALDPEHLEWLRRKTSGI